MEQLGAWRRHWLLVLDGSLLLKYERRSKAKHYGRPNRPV